MTFFSFFSCFQTTPIDKEKSNSYYIQNGKYYYIQNGNRLAQGKNQLKNVSGPLLILDSDLAMDNKTVYYKSYPQPHIDRNSFVVDKFVKKDQNHVYDRDFFKLKIVPDADPNTFQYQIIDSVNWFIWARDANHYFVSHHKVDVDYASFQIHNITLAHDAHHVYVRNGVQLLNRAKLAGTPKKLNKHFLADDESIYYYSVKKGFQIMPINGMNVTILKEDEIKVGETIISAYK
ncbi:MAG TPA: hypothetical protein VD884_19490 [Ohtaekwangia sp.]|nr:hypothetical protein [Ohtaekwangia sp.]